MAPVKIEDIIDHLDTEIQNALQTAVKEVLPNANFDEFELFKAFKNAVYMNCNVWEDVPDRYVEK